MPEARSRPPAKTRKRDMKEIDVATQAGGDAGSEVEGEECVAAGRDMHRDGKSRDTRDRQRVLRQVEVMRCHLQLLHKPH